MNASIARIEFGLCFSELMLGQGVSTDEFWKRYGTVQSGMRSPSLAGDNPRRSAGRLRPDGADSEAKGAGGGGQAAGSDAAGVDEAAQWIGDSCKAIDRMVYGGTPCQS